MSKYLIIHPEWDEFCKYLNDNMRRPDHIDVDVPLRSFFQNRLLFQMKVPHAIIKILYQKLRIKPFMKLVLGSWANHIREYDTIVLFNDVPCKWVIAEYISSYTIKNRVKVWFYDSVRSDNEKERRCIEKAKKQFDVVTFDPKDAKSLNIRFLPQFYVPYTRFDLNKLPVWDVFYCGTDKGRYEMLMDAIREFDTLNLKSFIYIKKDEGKQYPDEKYLHTESINYTELVLKLQDTKAILEINMSHQAGLSMRAMESIFYKKKLITNNIKVKSYDFYHKNNIFILGQKDNLQEFMETPYQEIDPAVLSQYDFYTWIQKIGSSDK